MTTMLMLDGVTAQYLLDSGISERMRYTSYQPGGEHFNDREAMRWFLSNSLGISVESYTNDRNRSITINTDGVNRDDLATLLSVELISGGVTMVFHSMTAEAEHYEEYGEPTTRRWIELSFRPAA